MFTIAIFFCKGVEFFVKSEYFFRWVVIWEIYRGNFFINLGYFLSETIDFFVKTIDFFVKRGDFFVKRGDFFVGRGDFFVGSDEVFTNSSILFFEIGFRLVIGGVFLDKGENGSCGTNLTIEIM